MYIPYDVRCKKLQMNTLSQRRKIAAIVFAIKEWQTTYESEIKTILRNAYYDTVASTRNRPMFANIMRYTSLTTPIAAIMDLLNKYAAHIDVEALPSANRNKLKKLFLDEQSA